MIRLAARLAYRELRSGLQGLGLMVACLALGVSAIAVVGALSAAIARGLSEQGQPLLGGDLEFAVMHRSLTAPEQVFLSARGQVSTVATLRGMASAKGERALVEVKAVDPVYPLFGTVKLGDGSDLTTALVQRGEHFGAIADPALLGKLGIGPGDTIQLGNREFELRAALLGEPDRVADGFALGPRLMISREGLAATGLVQPGSLVTWRHRLKLASTGDSDVKQVMQEARRQFPQAGWRIRGRDNAAPQVGRFVDRVSFFLSLAGLAALITGGVGVANTVRAFLNRRMANIAMFKCLGASAGLVFQIYLIEVLAVALLAVVIGLVPGAIAPAVVSGLFGAALPLPIATGVEWGALALAAVYGLIAAVGFAVGPLALAMDVRAITLLRSAAGLARAQHRIRIIAVQAVAALALAVIALMTLPDLTITAWFIGGLALSFAVLSGLARLLMLAAERLPAPANAVRAYAVSSLYRPGSATPSAVLSLGLGLTLFVTLALVDRSISSELRSSLPASAPSFYFLDVPNGERDRFVALLRDTSGSDRIGDAPMLRGQITKVNGIAADKVRSSPDARWALGGDRGLTYAAEPPRGSEIVAGSWWPRDYSGPPLVSFTADVANGLGLKLGDTISVNVLGREVTARIASLREVNWRSLEMNFVMIFSPNTLEQAPHTHLVTVHAAPETQPAVLKAVSRAYPAVTAISIAEALETVGSVLARLVAAVRMASGVTLFAGVLVLAGALAATLAGRQHDFAILKTFGATRRQLIWALVGEHALLGLICACFAMLIGSAAALAIVNHVLEMHFAFSLAVALWTALAAMALTIVAGVATAWPALSVRPARHLRSD
jgi:putative ABC transport system permease protein